MSETGARTDDGGAAAVGAPTFSPLYRQIKALILRGLQSGDWKPRPRPSPARASSPRASVLARARCARPSTSSPASTCWCGARAAALSSPRTTRRAASSASCGCAATVSTSRRDDEPHPRVPAHARAERDRPRALGLRAGETAVLLRRLLLFHRLAGRARRDLAARARFRGLSAERLDAYTGPLYGLFESEFDTRMIRAAERLKAVAASGEVARALQVPEGEPLLSLRLGRRLPSTTSRSRCGGYYVTRHYHYFNQLG